MGLFSVTIQVGDLSGSRFATLEAMADTGSAHSFIPRRLLDEVGADPWEVRSFAFADERVSDIPFGYARFIVQGVEVIAPVIFADDEAEPLLGATTLEAAHLAVDPINRTLIPVLPMSRTGNGRRGELP